MDSDNQFVAEEVNGGIRTIAETVISTFSKKNNTRYLTVKF